MYILTVLPGLPKPAVVAVFPEVPKLKLYEMTMAQAPLGLESKMR
jgi:hypothetical protein